MMALWLALLPGLPLMAALLLGSLHFLRVIEGEHGEKSTARIALIGVSLSAAIAVVLLVTHNLGIYQTHLGPDFGVWLQTDTLNVSFKLQSDALNLSLAALFALLILVALRFSVNYLHRETGFHRYYFLMCLFAAAMQLLVLSGSTVFTFFGWELAGVCSYFLIGYAYYRPVASQNALRALVTNRVGDGGFLLGIGLAASWLHTSDWRMVNLGALQLDSAQSNLLALCFACAAFAKSAQVPFTPWLARAMEGPTPSSAVFYGGVMSHAGVFLIIQLQDLFQQAPLAMAVLLGVGALTALYSHWVGLSQTDIKSSQIFATSAQLGLMFVECGLGLWSLAAWHLGAHAVVRCYLLLTSPAILQNTGGRPTRSVAPWLARQRGAFMSSLHRLWLEPAVDSLLVKPLNQLAQDAQNLEQRVIEPLLGVPEPAIQAISSLAQWEEQKMGANLESSEDSFAKGSGLAGALAYAAASLSHWFEQRLILQGVGTDMLDLGRLVGRAANRFEQLLLRPRYLTLFVLIVLLLALLE